MSVFQVSLNNIAQGVLDLNPATGGQMQPSKQRTVYIVGPNRTNRELHDGDTFTDCNYYKRYCAAPVGPLTLADATLTVLSDDGSIWVDHGPDAGVSSAPKAWTLAPAINTGTFSGTGYATNNVIDFYGTFGSYANYLQILNTGTVSLQVKFNGDVNAVMTLAAGDQQIFNHDDALISKVEFGNASGSTAGAVQVVASVASQANS